MKRLLLILFLLTPALAQAAAKTLALTAATSTCAGNTCVDVQVDPSNATASIQLGGTFVGTVAFEATGGADWAALNCTPWSSTAIPVTSATAAGGWTCDVAGKARVRARPSAYTSGTIVVSVVTADAQSLVSPVIATNTSAATSLSAVVTTGLVGTVVQAVTGIHNTWAYAAFNANATICWIQVFDLAAGSVTLGTSVPLYAIPILNVTQQAVGPYALSHHNIAVSIASTTTATGATPCAAASSITLWYS